jgi:uncharacterized protein
MGVKEQGGRRNMPDFANPFIGKLPGSKLSLDELVRAIRLDVAAEEEATHLYMAQAEGTDNELARKVLLDIANEERVHVGEFQRLLQLLTGDEDKWLADGAAEVDTMAASIGKAAVESTDGAFPQTIGSLKQSNSI